MIYKKLLVITSHREQDWGNDGKWIFHILSSQLKRNRLSLKARDVFLEKEHQTGKNKE